MALSLAGKVVFVTGASAGIGAGCARAFAELGARLLLLARRGDRLEALAGELRELGAADSQGIAADVRDFEAVAAAYAGLPPAWREVEVLINNAGLSRGLDPLQSGKLEDWNEMIDTNVKGLLHVNRIVLPGMVARGRGTVVHLGSIAGRQAYPGGNVYCGTKYAVRGITEGLRLDLLGTGVRVVSVDPGLLRSEFGLVRFRGDAARAEAVYEGMTPLTPDDVAEVVVFAATRPPHVTLAETLVLPTQQGSTVHVHRQRGD
jgi:3-hydroxy acid dehydrogenase/malonic semialdehyde reductase